MGDYAGEDKHDGHEGADSEEDGEVDPRKKYIRCAIM